MQFALATLCTMPRMEKLGLIDSYLLQTHFLIFIKISERVSCKESAVFFVLNNNVFVPFLMSVFISCKKIIRQVHKIRILHQK